MDTERQKIDWSIDQYCISCPKRLVPMRRGVRVVDLEPGTAFHGGKGRCYNCSRGHRQGYIPRIDISLYDSAKGLECKDCKETLPLDDFETHPNGRKWPACRQCTSLKHYYKITKAQYNDLLKAQDYRCGICKKGVSDIQTLCVDHDHSCCPTKARSCGNCVRGLLCSKCNKGIGFFDDSTESLKSAVNYLQSTKKD